MEKDCNFKEGGLQCRLENTGKTIPKKIFHKMQHFGEFERIFFGMILQMHLGNITIMNMSCFKVPRFTFSLPDSQHARH